MKTKQVEYKTPMLKFLQSKGIDLTETEHTAYTLRCCEKRSSHSSRTCVHGMMDLIVETFYEEKILKVSVCHYYEQQGDMMRDPEMVFRAIPELESEIPEYFRQDGSIPREDNVFLMQDGEQMYRPKLLKELKSFTKLWVKNLKVQGHELVQEDGS